MLLKIPQLFYTIFKALFLKSPANLPLITEKNSEIKENTRNLSADDASPIVVSIPISTLQETYHIAEKNSLIATIQVQFLGKFRVLVNGEPLILNGKNALIFASLLLDYPREIHKETLMQRFWADNMSAKNNLNVAICHIRKALKDLRLEQDIIVFDADFYSLSQDIQLETDIETFTQIRRNATDTLRKHGISAAVEAFERLLWLYNGDFLENYPNDTWALGERDSYSEYYFEALRLLSEHYEKIGNIERCIEYCRLMLRHDPHFEPIHRRLIQAYARLGAKDRAIRQYQDCVRALKHINSAPSRETQEVF